MRIFSVLLIIVLFVWIAPFRARAEDDKEIAYIRAEFAKTIHTQPATLRLPGDINTASWYAITLDDAFLIAPQGMGKGVLIKVSASNSHEIFSPYGEALADDIAVASCSREGKLEYATIPSTSDPHVLRFSPSGKKLNPGFLAGEKKNSPLNRIACADINNDRADEIIVAARINNEIVIGIYQSESGVLLKNFTIPQWGPYDFSVDRIDLGGDGKDEIMVTSGGMKQSAIYLYRTDGSLINTFSVFPSGFIGGVHAVGGDTDGDGKDEIILGAGAGGGQLRIMDGFGNEKITERFFPMGEGYRAGFIPLIVSPGSARSPIKTILLPASLPLGDTRVPKSILVDIATQRLSVLSYGHESARLPISTGTWNYPTPVGTHAIFNKIPRAYSRRYGLYMPWWMAIVPTGAYGLHELPEWPDGTKEGEAHLGTRRSHGCIRVGIGVAQSLYAWAEVGTRVTVR